MMMARFSIIFILACLSAGPVGAISEDDYLRPVGLPPKATPQMRQGGEALPPLPLPATPLRRSEKKRPPTPSTLIGKVIWGSYLDYTWDNGQTTRVFDWNMVPSDCQSLLRTAEQHLNIPYQVEVTTLQGFNATPAQIPVLYFSGGRALRFNHADHETLRRYLLAGGMIWFDSVVGSPYFYTSALSELRLLIPEAQIRRLPEDHPIFHMVNDSVALDTRTQTAILPVLDAVYIGSRVAAIVSPYGMGAGWDRTTPDLIQKADFYHPTSALSLGLNLVAYALGYFRVGQSHAKAQIYSNEEVAEATDPVVFAQIRTSGVWQTEPGGANNLLRFMKKNLYIKSSYQIHTVKLDKDPLSNYGFLYLTGISDFTFSDSEIAALRGYLTQGGYLLIDNALGLSAFASSVSRELQRVLPQLAFEPLPLDHVVFTQGPFAIQTVRYTLAARAKYPTLKTPCLKGITIDSRTAVIYSPFDMAAGWQGDEHPLSYGYETGDALRIGANLIIYCSTH